MWENRIQLIVTKHLTLLLFIGLAWGQTYYPDSTKIIYSVDLDENDYETGFNTDLHSIAQDILDSYNQN